jgi:hypothetical protein
VAERAPEALLSAFVAAQARLLRAESDDPRALSLRFDRGVLRVAVIDGGLELEVGGGEVIGAGAARLDEDDPWWTVIGHPLCGAWSLVDGEGRRTALELQFRPDGENPKILALEGHGLVLRAIGLAKSQWAGAQ